MNSNNHNPNIVPGYYNPQQSKTEALDYQAFLGENFVDPTQIPMHPGDTQRPMSVQNQLPVQENRQLPPSGYASGTPRANASPSLPEQQDRAGSPIGASTQNYQRDMQAIYQDCEIGARNSKTIEAIRIPIVIDLTININYVNNK